MERDERQSAKEKRYRQQRPKDKRGGEMTLEKNGGNKMERMSVKLETLMVMTQSQDFKGFDMLRSNSSVSMLL